MKRILFLGIMILSAAVWSMGCSKMEDGLSGKPDSSQPGRVRFVFEPKAELMASRAMDEAQESEVRDGRAEHEYGRMAQAVNHEGYVESNRATTR